MSEFAIGVLTIAGINVAMFASLATLVIWTVNKHEDEFKKVISSIDATGRRIDGHATRIDQLYQMFVDLVKEVKK